MGDLTRQIFMDRALGDMTSMRSCPHYGVMSIGLDRAVLHGMMMTGGNIAGKGKSGMKVEAR